MIKVNTPFPSRPTTTLWKSGCDSPFRRPLSPSRELACEHSISTGQSSCSFLFLPNLKGFNPLRQVLVPVLNSLNISPLKKKKKKKQQTAFSSNQLKRYVPISRAVIIYFTGVLRKRKKKIALKTHLALETYFPVSCKCFANAHPPFPSPPILQKPFIPFRKTLCISQYAFLEMCSRCLCKN